ncbi:MAG: hypothetical protein MSIBF_07030 [Candidatus Altiarchaeales archaeon IMC4]|nr:MAG: hypothetical protein MSIBF_07030 [Candidatus Altiarchaeales archaeon IMC4]
MTDNELYKNCLQDIICILNEIALDEKKDVEKFRLKGKKTGDPLYEYFKGRSVAYFEVLDRICNELEAFNINSKEVGMDIDPEKELEEIPDDWTPDIRKEFENYLKGKEIQSIQ